MMDGGGQGGAGGGGRKASNGRKRDPGLGVRRRRRDGTGRGVGPGAQVAQTPVAAAPTLPPSSTEREPGPAIVTPARTVAIVAHPDLCTLCEACLDACPRGSITLEETAVIDPQLCNGCGLCINDCSYGALALAEV
jgi:NAD-dependent dihydropyrimidine dehydrogenase PreA subunit